MKKNNFMQGAFIATMGIVISKILGIVYVIPFYAIIGEQGGALYGYAYNIYSLFMGISSAGIPLAMSKIISEYHTLGYYEAKEKAFKIGKRISMVLGFLSFIILFIFAKDIARLIIGNVTGGNTIEDIAFVIRVIATAILVVPVMSIYRGYLQGHKYIAPTSISQILEQLVRVIIIIVGSFVTLKVFNLSLRTSVGLALFGATVGALIAYFYLVNKVVKNKKQLVKESDTKEKVIVNSKVILKKLVIYAIPFIMIDIFKTLYDSVDIMMLVKILVNDYGFTARDAESIMSVISTWGLKLNMIVLSISTGVMVSLIPNLTSSLVSDNLVDVRRKVNQTLQILIYITLPMTIGLSMLSEPVWLIFYGPSKFGPSVFAYFIFVSLAVALFTATITTAQTLKQYKLVFIGLITGFLFKLIFNVPIISGFAMMGLPPYYGAITTTILGYLIASIIGLIFLSRKFKINYEETFKQIINIVIASLCMIGVILLMRFIIPTATASRFMNVFVVMAYSLVGAIVYIFITYKTKTINAVFGSAFVNKIKGIFKKKRG